MKRKGVAAEAALGAELEKIKKAGIVAMFADDDLMDLMVLKGGNAMDIVHRLNSRSSVDLDFSMREDLDHNVVKPKLERALKSTFELEGYLAFDVNFSQRPGRMPTDLASFWGGYLVDFKIVSLKRAAEVNYDVETMRREAVRLGEGTKFTIDISRYEYVEDKVEFDLDGYRIFVYSPEMIVCEKLRAICQQMPEYAPIIGRNGLGNQRARDFIDIEVLVRVLGVDLASDRARHTVREMFALKRVPLYLLSHIRGTREFHALGFDEVRAAMKPGVQIETFDHYFEFVVDQCAKLEALWDMKPPSADV